MNKYKYEVVISQDPDPENPRNFDNITKMVCFHNRYTIGDKTDLNAEMFNNWSELEEYLKKELKAVIVMPLFLLDHSGLRISINSFGCPFDSGKIGFIYIDKKTLKENKLNKEDAIRIMTEEVKVYDQYLSGDVWSYCIKKISVCNCCGENKTEIIDGCSGFFGYEEVLKEIPDKYKKYIKE